MKNVTIQQRAAVKYKLLFEVNFKESVVHLSIRFKIFYPSNQTSTDRMQIQCNWSLLLLLTLEKSEKKVHFHSWNSWQEQLYAFFITAIAVLQDRWLPAPINRAPLFCVTQHAARTSHFNPFCHLLPPPTACQGHWWTDSCRFQRWAHRHVCSVMQAHSGSNCGSVCLWSTKGFKLKGMLS